MKTLRLVAQDIYENLGTWLFLSLAATLAVVSVLFRECWMVR